MKQRIVEKLADLSKADSPEPVDSDMLKGIAYLSEFSEQLNVDPREIGKAARTALSALLNQYSDFHVSTIDSFFQTILRTLHMSQTSTTPTRWRLTPTTLPQPLSTPPSTT